jgi:hypothetical protein
MEVDTACLFADVGSCGGMEIPCYSLCKPPNSTEENSFLLGSNSKVEYLLLKYGRFDMLPCNVEEFHVCENHSHFVQSSHFKNCCLCKPLGRSKSSKSGLRIITKQYACAAWKIHGVRFSLGRKICTQCRNNFDKLHSNQDFRDECDILFQWLYDVNITHTPSAASSYSHNVPSQSVRNFTIEEDQKHLKEFLQSKYS